MRSIRIISNRIADPVIIIPIPGIKVSWNGWWCSLKGVTKRSWARIGAEAGEVAGATGEKNGSEEFPAIEFQFTENCHDKQKTI